MILVNGRQLDEAAFRNETHPLHNYAVQIRKGIEELKRKFGTSIRFKRPGYPRSTEGVDHRGNKVPHMAKPTPSLRLPLKARVLGELGEEIWEVCTGAEPLANNMWKATGSRHKGIEETLTLSLDKDAELAFFIYYKSSALNRKPGKERKGILIIDDPNYIAKEEGDKARAELELQTALYGVLADEDRLKVMAQAWGITKTESKHPDLIRKELKSAVQLGEKNKRSDPMAKGVKEFLEELKVTDAVRLRSLVKFAEDVSVLRWEKERGKYFSGERIIAQISPSDQGHRFDYLCNHLSNPANRGKLQDLLRDVVDRDYLDKIKDEKTYGWLARMMDIKTGFKKPQDIKELVYSCFLGDREEVKEKEEESKEA